MTVREFLFAHGQSADNVDVALSLQKFNQSMRLGLEGRGGMPMIPTYLSDVDRGIISPDSPRILIDAGGTNFRSALGYFDKNGVAHLEELVKTRMPASDGYLSKEEFYAQIARNLSPLLPRSDKIGFCFSYPVEMGADIDGTVQPFTKEVKAPEVVGSKVGAETVAACKKLDGKNRRIVILNDTVATMLGGMAVSDKKYSAYLGYIYGTGTNVCYQEEAANIVKLGGGRRGKMIVNTECGSFDGFERGDFDRAAALRTDNPDRQPFEKMTSGKYLAEIIGEAFSAAKREGLLLSARTQPFNLKDVSEFVAGEGLRGMFDENDVPVAKEICVALTQRAAKLGALVNGALATASCQDKTLPVAIVAEGTTFNKLPFYRSFFERYLAEIFGGCGITFQIVQGEELNLVGTLMATMALR